ncbi:MAG TPA: hypothetical protein VIR15_13810 [Intrasporangium sp.]
MPTSSNRRSLVVLKGTGQQVKDQIVALTRHGRAVLVIDSPVS